MYVCRYQYKFYSSKNTTYNNELQAVSYKSSNFSNRDSLVYYEILFHAAQAFRVYCKTNNATNRLYMLTAPLIDFYHHLIYLPSPVIHVMRELCQYAPRYRTGNIPAWGNWKLQVIHPSFSIGVSPRDMKSVNCYYEWQAGLPQGRKWLGMASLIRQEPESLEYS